MGRTRLSPGTEAAPEGRLDMEGEYGRVVTWTQCLNKHRLMTKRTEWRSALPRLQLITDRQSELEWQSNYHGKGDTASGRSQTLLLHFFAVSLAVSAH